MDGDFDEQLQASCQKIMPPPSNGNLTQRRLLVFHATLIASFGSSQLCECVAYMCIGIGSIWCKSRIIARANRSVGRVSSVRRAEQCSSQPLDDRGRHWRIIGTARLAHFRLGWLSRAAFVKLCIGSYVLRIGQRRAACKCERHARGSAEICNGDLRAST